MTKAHLDGLLGGESHWQLDFLACPPNDNFADRIRLQGRCVRFQADLKHVTVENGLEHVVWFTWSAPVAIFRGSALDSLVLVEDELESRFAVQQGEDIQIRVGQYGSSKPRPAMDELQFAFQETF